MAPRTSPPPLGASSGVHWGLTQTCAYTLGTCRRTHARTHARYVLLCLKTRWCRASCALRVCAREALSAAGLPVSHPASPGRKGPKLAHLVPRLLALGYSWLVCSLALMSFFAFAIVSFGIVWFELNLYLGANCQLHLLDLDSRGSWSEQIILCMALFFFRRLFLVCSRCSICSH